jgi:hypothetical protein
MIFGKVSGNKVVAKLDRYVVLKAHGGNKKSAACRETNGAFHAYKDK